MIQVASFWFVYHMTFVAMVSAWIQPIKCYLQQLFWLFQTSEVSRKEIGWFGWPDLEVQPLNRWPIPFYHIWSWIQPNYCNLCEGQPLYVQIQAFVISIQGPVCGGKQWKFPLSSDWPFQRPLWFPALGSSVAFDSCQRSDLLCTLCQNLCFSKLINFNSTKCLYVASTGIPGTVHFIYGIYEIICCICCSLCSYFICSFSLVNVFKVGIILK